MRIITRVALGMAIGTFCLLAFVLATTHIDTPRIIPNEASAVGSLRTLHSAIVAYAKDHPQQGYPSKLSDLAPLSENLDHRDEHTRAIDPVLATGVKSGYRFTYAPHSSKRDGKLDIYEVSADPLQPDKLGYRHFFLNESGLIRMLATGPATATSFALE